MAYSYLTTYTAKGKNIYGKDLTNYTFTIDVYIEQSDVVSNYTKVKFVPGVHYTAGVTTTSSTYYFKENGTNIQYTYVKLGVTSIDYYFNDYIKTYYHNQDGSKSISINFSVETEISEGANANLNNYAFKSANISATISLPTISRISTLSPNDTFVMGKATSMTINRYVSSFTHTLYYHFGNASGTIGTGLTTSASWTPSRDLGNQIPNSTSGICVLTLETYNGSTLIGSSTLTFALWIAGDMFPTFNFSYTGNGLYNDLFITEYSSITFNITGATGSYGSTIKSYSISGEGLNTTNTSGTSSKFSRSGTFTYTLSVTDSRNRTATKTQSIVVYYYTAPTLSINQCVRADESFKPSTTGSYATIEVSYSVQNPASQNVNSKLITLKYKLKGSDGYFTTAQEITPSDYSSNAFSINVSTTTYDLSKAYELQISIKDDKKTTTLTVELPTATAILEISPNGIGVGKYWENGSLDISGDMYVNGKKFYETGTFNPAFYVSDGCSGVYTRRDGYYQKVGEWCTCNISLVVENFFNGSTPTNQFKIINLPFYNKGTYCAVTIGHLEGIVHTTMDAVTKACIIANTSDVVFVCTCETTGKVYSVTGSNIPGDRLVIQVSFTYKVE